MMHPEPFLTRITSLLLLMGTSLPSFGFVNPKLQPVDLAEQYTTTLALEVTAVDSSSKTASCRVSEVLVGKSDLKTVTFDFSDRQALQAFFSLSAGTEMVAYVGQEGPPAAPENVLIYLGGALWHLARITEENGVWEMGGNANDEAEETLFGTFNGRTLRLIEMMRDQGKDRGYFPAVPAAVFSEDIIAENAVTANSRAGLIDLDGDGNLDLIATTSGPAVVAYNREGIFRLGDLPSGLTLTGPTSLSAADANGDGTLDILGGSTLFLGMDSVYKSMPLTGIDRDKEILQSLFADLDQDGDQDIVVSYVNGGLVLLRNAGDGSFAQPEVITDSGTGYVDITDWNLDGRLDLSYNHAGGSIFIQNPDRGFQPLVLLPNPEEHMTFGGQTLGAFGLATLWDLHTYSALLPWESGAMLLRMDPDAEVEDVTRSTNELQEPSSGLAQVVLADFSADGLVDVYAAGKEKNSPSMYWENRGYGSYIQVEKYASGSVPATTFSMGASAMAASDVDGDGDEDMLVVRADGSLVLLRNQTVDKRPEEVLPTHTQAQKRRIQTRIIRVEVPGASGRGAEILLLRGEEIVARRMVGSGSGTGNAVAQTSTLAVRDPGTYTLTVRRSDGKAWTHSFKQSDLPRRPVPIRVP